MSTLLVACALALAASVGAAAPELIVDIDFNDEVYMREEPITEAEVEQLIRDLHANGVQTLLVRMGYLGYLPYRTELSYPMGFDEEHARSVPTNRATVGADLDQWIAVRKAANERYARVIEAFNPPEVFIRVGHQLGMKVIMWLDIFDDGYPGYRSKFLVEHPYCQWTAKDGKTRFEGLTSYAWPEARAFRVAQAKELLDLGADGIHCSTSAHCRHMPNVHEDDFYGYEEPIVDAYRTKYGADIRQTDEFNRRAWHVLKGEAMNQLYRELAAICHARGKELWVGLQLGEYTQLAADPYFSDNVVARYANNWKALVDEGVADALVVGDYEICTQPDHAYWSKKGIARREGEDLFAWAAREYQGQCRERTRLYLFSEWLPGGRDALEGRLAEWAQRARANGFDGIDVHEAANFEANKAMDLLQRMADQMAGKGPGAPTP
jgi:hypothetical protein